MDKQMSTYVVMCGLGVAVTSSLVVSNKVLLMRLPAAGAAEGLTLMHNLISVFTTRLCCPDVDKSKHVDRRWLFGVGLVCMATVLTSNVTLQYSSVAFQQLARSASIPASAALDFFMHGKVVSALERDLLGLLLCGVWLGVAGDVTSSPLGVACAAASVATALGANMIVRHVSKQSSLKSIELVYFVAPWTLMSGALAFTTKMAAQGDPGTVVRGFGALLTQPTFVAILVFNGSLSFGVQYCSTWAQTNCSFTGYAVLNQAKTACTVLLGALVLATAVSLRTWCGLTVTLSTAFAITLAGAPKSADSDPESATKGDGSSCAKRALPMVLPKVLVLALLAFLLSPTASVAGGHLTGTPAGAVPHHGAGPQERSHSKNAGSDSHHERAAAAANRSHHAPVVASTTLASNAHEHQHSHLHVHANQTQHAGHDSGQQARGRQLESTASDVRFIVLTPTMKIDDTRTCGGCTVMHVLAQVLRKHGRRTRIMPFRGRSREQFVSKCEEFTKQPPRASSKYAIIYPETFFYRCPEPDEPSRTLVHAHWILSPMGAHNAEALDAGKMDPSWLPDDFVFNYGSFGPGLAAPIPTSNLLQVVLNPSEGDEFDLARYPRLTRRGTVFMTRKAATFHPRGVTRMHPSNATELTSTATMEEHIQAFRTHRYFVCYDPYSFYAWIAAMLGCVTIIHPIANMTKREWLMTTMYAGFLEHSGAADMAGIAYGWGEAPYAAATMSRTRQQLFELKEFAHNVTVGNFVRDMEDAAHGKRSGFASAMRVRDFYPRRWWFDLPPEQRAALGKGSLYKSAN